MPRRRFRWYRYEIFSLIQRNSFLSVSGSSPSIRVPKGSAVEVGNNGDIPPAVNRQQVDRDPSPRRDSLRLSRPMSAWVWITKTQDATRHSPPPQHPACFAVFSPDLHITLLQHDTALTPPRATTPARRTAEQWRTWRHYSCLAVLPTRPAQPDK